MKRFIINSLTVALWLPTQACIWFEGYNNYLFSPFDPQEFRERVEKTCNDNWKAYLGSTEEYYWLGYILALFQWKTGYSFGNILSITKAEDILRLYPALHTVAEDNVVDVILGMYKKSSQYNRLQEYRKRLGMTQLQLAKAAGVNIRTLQQYEAGTKSIKKAAAETVFSLAAVLECQPEELVV